MRNAVGRDIPEVIDGYGRTTPFIGAFTTMPAMNRQAPRVKRLLPGTSKLRASIEEVFTDIPVRDGMTLSFHHHLRDGDGVVNLVLDIAAKMGIKGLTVALSSVFAVHAPMIEHMKAGVVTGLDTNYMTGPVAKVISEGVLAQPAVLRTHGGRARAMECGQLKVDVAFIAAPAADEYGNANGVLGPNACGALGYAYSDAAYADTVVVITDCLMDYPLSPVSIPQTRVDYVVTVESIGDAEGIVSGTTRVTKEPIGLKIAETAAKVIQAAGLIKDGFSFQTGAGGAALATAYFVRGMMECAGVKGSFALGGITGYLVEMLEQGLFRNLLDVQSFDLEAVRSLGRHTGHVEIGADFYASPFTLGAAVDKLDVVILGATEIDTDFNVNVATGSDGYIMGGSGGHSDAAAGAKVTMIVTNLLRSRLPIIRDRVVSVTTPGETVDVVVTERGVAVNPRRQDLVEALSKTSIEVKDIQELQALAERLAGGPPQVPVRGDRIVAVVEYRDGTVMDVIRQVRK